MTVQELIEELKRYDPNLEIITFYNGPVSLVESTDKDKIVII